MLQTGRNRYEKARWLDICELWWSPRAYPRNLDVIWCDLQFLFFRRGRLRDHQHTTEKHELSLFHFKVAWFSNLKSLSVCIADAVSRLYEQRDKKRRHLLDWRCFRCANWVELFIFIHFPTEIGTASLPCLESELVGNLGEPTRDFAQIAIRKIFWHGPFSATCWNLQTFLQVLSILVRWIIQISKQLLMPNSFWGINHDQVFAGFCLGSWVASVFTTFPLWFYNFPTWTLNRSETLGR